MSTQLLFIIACFPGNIAALPYISATLGQQFTPPLKANIHIIQPFSPGKHRWNRGHRGVDFTAVEGTVIYAAGAGNITFAANSAGIPIVSIRHPAGFITTYEPVRATVSRGQTVHTGDQIGIVQGKVPHCAQCLHWGARYFRGHQSRYFDPLVLIGLAHIILKLYEISTIDEQ